jgi:hypothetical protein
MKKKKTAPGGASKNTPQPPDGCNCYEFDGQRFVPGIPVVRLAKTRRLGVPLIREDVEGGIPLAENSARRPKVIAGRVYVAGLNSHRRELTDGREGGRHLLILTPECSSFYALQLSSAHDRAISAVGPFEGDTWKIESEGGASFSGRAFRLLLRLPYEGQDDCPDIDASVAPAVRLHLFGGQPPRVAVIGADPAYVRSAKPCLPWVARLKDYAFITRKAASRLSQKLFAASEKVRKKGLSKKKRLKVKITLRRRVRESVLA